MSTDVDVIERVIDIAASPETVFTLLTDPAEYVRWKGRLAELDPRAGGRFHVLINDTAVRGEYVEVVPNRRVVFTWGWEGADAIVGPGGSTVEIDLEPRDGGTRLRLVHRGLPAAELASHTAGWDYFLPRLTAVAEGREPAA
ncbi:MAG TPA: SRPBCC domain-containing protein [Candidatus Limnocylindria bacterium]|nr:SRPBCC domain-containing protein [Candidatus Limnocylindria bacterium]